MQTELNLGLREHTLEYILLVLHNEYSSKLLAIKREKERVTRKPLMMIVSQIMSIYIGVGRFRILGGGGGGGGKV